MNNDLKILILSHKRAGIVKTHKIINAPILVPESQFCEYAKFHKENDLITHPDSVIGLNQKRQWVLDNNPNDSILMLDDDITSFQRTYFPETNNYKRDYIITNSEAIEIVNAVSDTAKKLGAKLWGFASHCGPQNYNPLKPFSFGGYIPGGCLGFHPPHNIFFPKNAYPGNDYWCCLINAYLNRYCFIDKRFSFIFSKTYDGKGGLSEFRGLDGEKKGTEFLKKHFGDAIISKRFTPQTKVEKVKNLRSIKIPWKH